MLSVGQQPTNPVLFHTSSNFSSKKQNDNGEFHMDRFFSEYVTVTTLAVGLFLSIAIFGAFKTGQLFERSTIAEGIHDLALEKLKQKTESKLKMLWKQYRDTNGTLQLPKGLRFKDVVEHSFVMDEDIKEQFLGLNKIYLDLISNGTDSSYFVSILDTYGHIVGSTTIGARSTVEFLGTVIREVPPRATPIQFLRELEKRLRVKHRIHITACHLRSAIHSKFRNLGNSIPIKELTKGMSVRGSLLDAVQLAETLGTAGVKSPQVSVLWGAVKHIRQGPREISLLHSSGRSKVPSDVQQVVSRSGTHAPTLSLYTPAGRKAAGEGGGHWARSISSEFPIQIEAPIKKILRRLRDRGLISRRRPWLIHVACLTNVSDGDIVNWSAGIAISLLTYYSWQSESTLFRAFSCTLSAYWIGRYSLSSRLLIELVGNGREGNRQINGQLKEGNARGVSGLFCLACYWEERAAVILRFVRESTAHE
ncbi:hypothetical protein CQW23_14068 [Capsicum baccatum]|uniref:Uncharacterized protein n=1 Tax=Capsicum baccatum TaxID=33114 RepID=A0A2G2WID5_CAPBA|nr:hypothetical protein CQW23_14068 [Capsicum baccatum]